MKVNVENTFSTCAPSTAKPNMLLQFWIWKQRMHGGEYQLKWLWMMSSSFAWNYREGPSPSHDSFADTIGSFKFNDSTITSRCFPRFMGSIRQFIQIVRIFP